MSPKTLIMILDSDSSQQCRGSLSCDIRKWSRSLLSVLHSGPSGSGGPPPPGWLGRPLSPPPSGGAEADLSGSVLTAGGAPSRFSGQSSGSSMDSAGRKVVVCDNGTGVSPAAPAHCCQHYCVSTEQAGDLNGLEWIPVWVEQHCAGNRKQFKLVTAAIKVARAASETMSAIFITDSRKI